MAYNAHNSGQPKAGPIACTGYGAWHKVYPTKIPALGGALQSKNMTS